MKKTLFIYALLLRLAPALFAQTDTVPPVITCPEFIYRIPSIDYCTATVWKDELIEFISDNFSPVNEIETGIRRTCIGTGFPEGPDSIILESGNITYAEVWAKDMAGNTSICQTRVVISDGGTCEAGLYLVDAKKPQGGWLDRYTFVIGGSNCMMDSFKLDLSSIFFTSIWGYQIVLSYSPVLSAYDYYVEPSKNINPKNGVDNNDIQLIYNYFAGIDTLSPWQLIAADANQDGKVTIYDVVVIRRLLLGLSDEFPNGKSWRFVPSNYVFPNPANPFQPAFPERATYTSSLTPTYESSFIAVKIGDVNGSADPKN